MSKKEETLQRRGRKGFVKVAEENLGREVRKSLLKSEREFSALRAGYIAFASFARPLRPLR